MKIYFSGDQNSSIFNHLHVHLRNFGDILTESNLEGRVKYDTFMHSFSLSDVFVFELTCPTMNLGYELGRIIERNHHTSQKPLLCLFDVLYGSDLPMACPSLNHCFGYKDVDGAKKAVDFFFKIIKDN